MKKTLSALALATAGLLPVSATLAQSTKTSDGGWFVNGNVGRASIDKSRSGTGFGVNAGYRWAPSQSFALGMEAGYTDLQNARTTDVFKSKSKVANKTSESQLHGWTLGMNGRFDINPNWYLSARTGIYGWSAQNLGDVGIPAHKTEHYLSVYAGAGVGYNVNRHVSLGLNFDRYYAKKYFNNLSTNVVSASAEYRF